MGQITITINTDYNKGDVVVFRKNAGLSIGIIEGFNVDSSSNNNVWYNIRTTKDFIYTYTNGGDIAEFDIVNKFDGHIAEIYKELILGE